MKAWIIPKGSASGHDALRLVDRPSPTVGDGEVRVRVGACSLNYRDLVVSKGQFGYGAVPRDTVPMSDGAGEVVEVGKGVTQLKPGDRVAGCFFQDWVSGAPSPSLHASALGGPIDGMLAEEVVLRASGVVAIPRQVSFAEASTLPCAAVTAWNALFEVAAIRPGQTVLTQGTGGVSVFAIQMAVAAGARVIATSSSDAKLQRARSLGAHELINYTKTPDWDQEVLRLTQGRGVDCVVEVGGTGTLPRSMHAVRLGGTIALIGILADPTGAINPLALIPKAARLQGVYVGSRSMFEDLIRWLELHRIHPVIDRVFPFADAARAYAHQEGATHVGKVVIAVS